MVNQIYNDLHHHVLFLRPALSYHQGKGYEGVVSQSLAAVRMVEDAVVVEKPQEERGGEVIIGTGCLIQRIICPLPEIP